MDEYDQEEQDRRCWSCNMPLRSDERVYSIEGEWCCEECAEDYILSNYTIKELAVELGIESSTVSEALDG